MADDYFVIAGVPRMKAPVLETPIMDFRLQRSAPFVSSLVRQRTCPNPECGRFRYRFIPGSRISAFDIDCLFCGKTFLVN